MWSQKRPIRRSIETAFDQRGRLEGLPVRLGALLMPSHPPECSTREGQRRDLEELQRLDRLGFDEAWIGEHYTSVWEPCPAPDLLIAQALLCTRQIRLGPLGHLLPYHHPIELAHRVAYLDHMAEGRYHLGVGISALPTDHELFGIDTAGGRNRRMTFESLDMMTSLWSDGPRDFKGEFWSTCKLKSASESLGYHLKPFQRPHPPIAIAGMTAGSENHRLAGEKGYIPVSFSISPDAATTARHWEAVLEGAARTGRTPNRADWSIVRDVYVAPTDEEARDLATSGMMGRCWREFLLPLYLKLGLGKLLKVDAAMPDEAIDLDYLAKHLWFVGSPTTVARRIQELQAGSGGFGHLMIVSYDATDERGAWERSLELLVHQVLPLCNDCPETSRLITKCGHELRRPRH
jgi:alkanesulfonate monooxygenase SsuD/methylene tetrahydromethanopterin reductase-like flavin-dependent oxidoreductase (luciferase family)